MFSSQATGAAKSAGLEPQTIGQPGQVESRDRCVVVLDLTNPGMDIAATVASLKEHDSSTIVAVGPHVHEAKLTAATEAGCDHVITKGQASRELASLLTQIRESE